MLTRNSPTTYYEGPHGTAGLDYELAYKLAEHLGVELKIIVPDSLNDLLDDLNNGKAHIAAAGLTVTEERKELFKFGPGYQHITEQLVYNRSQKRPKSLDDVQSGLIEVVAGSSHSETLKQHQLDHPDLKWKETDKLESEELLQLVADNIIDYTIADSNELLLNKRFLLNIKSAFDVSPEQTLAWALPKNDDNSLHAVIVKFFAKIKKNGQLTRAIERTYGHAENLDYVGTMFFKRHVETRLPKYRSMFIKAAEENNLDWHLLAAIGYQESHWDPDAVSPTGVRGIMMLTQATAAQLDIENRLDPESSIDGGARYFARRMSKLPTKIKEPDLTWMALAAYNVGAGHLEDARIISQKLGKNPNKWHDVKEAIPLLAKKKWHKDTKHGYARGWEPVRYVENIRSYYDIMRWLNNTEQPKEKESDVFSKLPQVP